MLKPSLHAHRACSRPLVARSTPNCCAAHRRRPAGTRSPSQRRCFHEYFITHLPSTSLHPDSRSLALHHKFPRDKSTPHESQGTQRSPAAALAMAGASREMTVVRIPLRSAKHHFGVSVSRGTRPYNEDSFQAGTVEVPAFAKRRPMSLQRGANGGMASELTPAGSASGDPQVFYFGVFDGHGGSDCADFLREELHHYVEDAMKLFELKSSLAGPGTLKGWQSSTGAPEDRGIGREPRESGKESLDAIETHTPPGLEPLKPPEPGSGNKPPANGANGKEELMESAPPVKQSNSVQKAEDLERALVKDWKELVGGFPTLQA